MVVLCKSCAVLILCACVTCDRFRKNLGKTVSIVSSSSVAIGSSLSVEASIDKEFAGLDAIKSMSTIARLTPDFLHVCIIIESKIAGT